MLPQQKQGVFTIATTLAAIALFVASHSLALEYQATAGLAILAALIILNWILRQLFGIKPKAHDERDIAISYKAGIIALALSTTFFMLACILLIARFQAQRLVPITYLTDLVFFSWIILYLTWAICSLILYRRGV